MSDLWYVAKTVDGRQKRFDPASLQQLKKLAQVGKLHPSDLVCQEGMDRWLPAASISDLFTGRPVSVLPLLPPLLPVAQTGPGVVERSELTTEQLPACVDEPSRPRYRPRRRSLFPALLAAGCGLFLVITFLGLMASQWRELPVVPPPQPIASVPPPVLLTEAEARAKVKSVLDAWVGDDTPQSLARKFPKIEFADPLFTDGCSLLRFDIQRTNLYESLGNCEVRVRMVSRGVNNDELKYERWYKVLRPNDKGIWRVEVNEYTPWAPTVSEAPNVDVARDYLKAVLNAWVAGQWKAELAKTYPSIDFTDLLYSDTILITRFDIGKADGPYRGGTWKFPVYLVFLTKKNTEQRMLRVFEIDKPDQRGIWHIRGLEP